MGTYTTKKQSNIKLQADIWTDNNDYHIISELRYRNWPSNFYGIGMDTKKVDEDLISQKLFRAKLEVEKRMASNYYAGVNIQYDYVQFHDREPGGIFDQTAIIGKNGGQQLLLGISQLYDNRNHVSYTTHGYYARAKLAYAPKLWTKEDFEGANFDADIRGFFPINKKKLWTSRKKETMKDRFYPYPTVCPNHSKLFMEVNLLMDLKEVFGARN